MKRKMKLDIIGIILIVLSIIGMVTLVPWVYKTRSAELRFEANVICVNGECDRYDKIREIVLVDTYNQTEKTIY